ncbi:MAG TPA: peptidylprolyl isomerase [archaeon]|nr:peptidylprolyl isomerase [archaeon]
MSSQIEAGDQIAVEYTGKLQDGTVFDSSAGRAPLEFTAGAGQMIKGFDTAVIGMKQGEKKTVTLPPEEAYGMPDTANVFVLPLSNIPNGTKVGDALYATNGQSVVLIAVTNETATIDANHFLAGKTLIFDIEVVKITKK